MMYSSAPDPAKGSRGVCQAYVLIPSGATLDVFTSCGRPENLRMQRLPGVELCFRSAAVEGVVPGLVLFVYLSGNLTFYTLGHKKMQIHTTSGTVARCGGGLIRSRARAT